jgi:hypothetical protein
MRSSLSWIVLIIGGGALLIAASEMKSTVSWIALVAAGMRY